MKLEYSFLNGWGHCVYNYKNCICITNSYTQESHPAVAEKSKHGWFLRDCGDDFLCMCCTADLTGETL